MGHDDEAWLIHVCHDSSICAMVHVCDKKACMGDVCDKKVDAHGGGWDTMNDVWLIHMCHDSLLCAMTHSYLPWLIKMCRDSYIGDVRDDRESAHGRGWDMITEVRLIHLCHDSLLCGMTHSYVPWLIHMCRDSFIGDTGDNKEGTHGTHSYVPWLTPMCHDSFICAVTHS